MSDDSIRIEYNESLKPLEELLEGVQRAGNFFVSGRIEIPMPKVEVEGVGTLSFPVPAPQIQQLIARATRAPYGRGEETILDESVRKAWQLPPDNVRIGGKSWAASFENILQQVIAGLGCEGMPVSAQLHKLLVYDRGGFFLAHRDTEKAGGMFGTLVLVLPSAQCGGELVVRHAGREVTLDLSGAEVSEVNFAAFYADCEHEVKPITEGNRVCLIYNLIQRGGAKEEHNLLQAPHYEKEIAATANLLKNNLAGTGAPAKIAWLLEHQYSPEGLSFHGLKSADAARVKVLSQAAERAECATHLGIIHIEESGSANPIYHEYRSRRWRHYHDDEDEVENASDDDFEVIEVCDWRHYIAEWRDPRDEPVEFGEIPLEPGELLPAGALDDEEPDEQRFMEASGNEGASFERMYHRAALVIWRRERYAEVLLQAGVAAALPYLKEKVEACLIKNAPSVARREAVTLVRKMIKAWREAPEYRWREPARPEKRESMLTLLAQLRDPALLAEFVAKVVIRDYDGSDNAALVVCAPVLDAEETGKLYAELVRRHMRRLPGHCVELLHALVKGNAASKPDWQSALRHIAEAILSKLDEVGTKPREDEWADWRTTKRTRPVSAALVANLFNAVDELEAPALRITAGEKFAARPDVFDPLTILVPALASLHAWDEASAKLWEHSVVFLLRRSGRPPEAPKDWRQDVKLSCSCPDCRELQKFTLDPDAQVARFRVRQDRRQHLHQMIEKHSLDMTHVTERKGSPQTLVCTKDRRSYLRRCNGYRQDIAALGRLAELADKALAPSAILKGIDAARSAAGKWSPDL